MASGSSGRQNNTGVGTDGSVPDIELVLDKIKVFAANWWKKVTTLSQARQFEICLFRKRNGSHMVIP